MSEKDQKRRVVLSFVALIFIALLISTYLLVNNLAAKNAKAGVSDSDLVYSISDLKLEYQGQVTDKNRYAADSSSDPHAQLGYSTLSEVYFNGMNIPAGVSARYCVSAKQDVLIKPILCKSWIVGDTGITEWQEKLVNPIILSADKSYFCSVEIDLSAQSGISAQFLKTAKFNCKLTFSGVDLSNQINTLVSVNPVSSYSLSSEGSKSFDYKVNTSSLLKGFYLDTNSPDLQVCLEVRVGGNKTKGQCLPSIVGQNWYGLSENWQLRSGDGLIVSWGGGSGEIINQDIWLSFSLSKPDLSAISQIVTPVSSAVDSYCADNLYYYQNEASFKLLGTDADKISACKQLFAL